jgi:hypothetical protein
VLRERLRSPATTDPIEPSIPPRLTILPLVAVAFTGLLTIAAYLYIYVGHHFLDPQVYPVIRGDGAGYYAYLPAFALQHDPTFHQFVAHDLRGFSLAATGLRLDPVTGNYLDKYSIGEAVMLLPFFLIGHVAAVLFGQRADGFSAPEQIMTGLGGAVYMILGVLVLCRSLTRLFRPGVVAATAVTVVFGSDLFNYATFDSMFSHAFAFFLVALLIELVFRWQGERPPGAIAPLIGLIVGLIALVRPTNLVFALLIVLFGIYDWASLRARLAFLRRQVGGLVAMAAVGAAVFLPQLGVWHIATGHWITNPYVGEGFNFGRPHLTDALFRLYYHGFFPWAPIMVLAVIGTPLMWRHARSMLLPTVVIFLINLYLIASWSTWFYGGGFGHRGFIDEFPLLAFGLASLYASARTIPDRIVVAVPALAACVVTTVMMVHYWQFVLSPGGASIRQYFAILLSRL